MDHGTNCCCEMCNEYRNTGTPTTTGVGAINSGHFLQQSNPLAEAERELLAAAEEANEAMIRFRATYVVSTPNRSQIRLSQAIARYRSEKGQR